MSKFLKIVGALTCICAIVGLVKYFRDDCPDWIVLDKIIGND